MNHLNSSKSVLAYARVSTTIQVEEGISIDSQKQRLQQWCDFKGHTLTQFFIDEGLSAGNMNRPQLMKLLDSIREGNIVLISDLSRLSRSMDDAVKITKAIDQSGGFLVCLSPDLDFSSSQGRLMMHVLFAFSEFERSQIKERVKSAMATVKRNGTLRGKSPFGYMFIGKETAMVKCPEQQAVIARIIDEYLNHGKNYAHIAVMLNNEGLNSVLSANKKVKKTQLFYTQTVKTILRDAGIIDAEGKPTITERYMDSRRSHPDKITNKIKYSENSAN